MGEPQQQLHQQGMRKKYSEIYLKRGFTLKENEETEYIVAENFILRTVSDD